jgi:hypothetical protein
MMAHSVVLITKRNAELRAANEAASRRKSHKRKRMQQQGTLTVEEGIRLTALKKSGARGDGRRQRRERALMRAASL